jgi:aspartate aminotransferase-like enzyme
MKFLGAVALIAAVMALIAAVTSNGVAAAPNAATAQAAALTDKGVEAIALQWFERMRTGQIDRTQLTAQYSTQLTDDDVRKMSAYLTEYKYGASPTGAKILRTRIVGEQTFYDVKLTFPRGDAASLLLGFDGAGKITGLVLMSMAGD